MKFAPSSVQIMILCLLAVFILTACGDQTQRAPAQRQQADDGDDDDQDDGKKEGQTPQEPAE